MRRAFGGGAAGVGFDLLPVEYAQLALYGGDVLVEHDVTFDLFGQIARRDGKLSSWWTTGAGSGWRGGSPHVIAAWW